MTTYSPDHNAECCHCDEWGNAHICPTLINTLRALIATWRQDADGVTAMGYSQQGDRIRDCADALAHVLTHADAPP